MNQSSPRAAKFERTAIVASTCSALWLLCWFLIWRWYSLSQHLATPFYALDKVPGHFQSPQIRATGLLFLTLSLLHSALCVWLAKTRRTVFNRTLKISFVVALTGVALANIFLYPIGAVDVFYYLCQLKLPIFLSPKSLSDDIFADLSKRRFREIFAISGCDCGLWPGVVLGLVARNFAVEFRLDLARADRL